MPPQGPRPQGGIPQQGPPPGRQGPPQPFNAWQKPPLDPNTRPDIPQQPAAPRTPEQRAPERTAPEQDAATQKAPENKAPETPGQKAPEQGGPGQRAPEQDATGQKSAEQRAQDHKAPEQDAPGQKAPEQDAADQKAAEQGTPEQGLPERKAPEHGAPDKTAEQGAPEQGTPEQGGPEQGKAEQDAPEKDGPEQRADDEKAAERDGSEQDGKEQDGQKADEEASRRDDGDRVAEDYVTDPGFRTDRPEDFRALADAQMDTFRSDGADNNAELPHELSRRDAYARRAENPRFQDMSDDGVYAVHTYTRPDVFEQLNQSLRTQDGNFADSVQQARAIASGLNELPPHEGLVSRRVGVMGRAAELLAAQYKVGEIAVETQFNSSSKVTEKNPSSKFRGQVELRITSKTGRDIDQLGMKREGEVLFKPGTQLLVTRNEKVGDVWIIEAEEIGPDDTRYLKDDVVRDKMDERRQLSAEQARELAEAPARDMSIADKLGGGQPQPDTTPPAPEPEPEPLEHRGEPADGWGSLAQATNPPGEPAIHAGTANSPEQQVRFLMDNLPETQAVNAHNFHGWNALEEGYRTNSSRSVVAFEERMQGQDSTADPVPPDQVSHDANLDYVQDKLGGDWQQHGDFDAALRDLAERPVGSRSVLAFESEAPSDPADPNSPKRVVSHLVTAVNTEHGLALVDPQNNRLADLPDQPSSVATLPYHQGDGPVLDHDTSQDTGQDTDTPQPEGPLGDLVEPDNGRPDEGYLFDDGFQATPEDHRAVADAFQGEGRHEAVTADAVKARDADPRYARLSDEDATVIRGYTGHDFYSTANAAHREGPGHPDFDRSQQQVRALVSALNKIEPTPGELLRGLNFGGDPIKIQQFRDQYPVGKTVVETTPLSASKKVTPDQDSEAGPDDRTTPVGKKLDPDQGSKFGPDVEMHIDSKTFRDVEKLSQNRSEGESLGKPATQLYVHENKIVTDPVTHQQKLVIRAEEIVFGDPRWVEKDDAEQQMAERREQTAANERENAARAKAAPSPFDNLTTLNPAPESTATPQPQRDIADALGGNDNGGYAGADQGPDGPSMDASQVGDHDWSPLARATNPPGEPAIHADTANPNQQAKYLAERHPEMAGVNPNFHSPDAFANGYQTNCTRGMVAHALRLGGIDAEAGRLLPEDMASMGTLDYVRENLGGGDWQGHSDYDDVIRTMRDQPIGSRAVIAVQYVGDDGNTYGHVAEVVHTKEGVAFIDPQSNSLMSLPHPPVDLKTMPFDPAKAVELHNEKQQATPDTTASADTTQPVPKPDAPVDPRIAFQKPDAPVDPRIAWQQNNPPAGSGLPPRSGYEVRPSRIGPDGRPVPSVSHTVPDRTPAADRGGYGMAEPPRQDPTPDARQNQGQDQNQNQSPDRDQDSPTPDERPLPTRQEIEAYLDSDRVRDAIREGNEITARDPEATVKVGDQRLPIGDAIRAMMLDSDTGPAVARILRDTPFLENSLLARPQTLCNVLKYPGAVDVLESCVREVRDYGGGPGDLADSYKADPKPAPSDLTPEQARLSAEAFREIERATPEDLRQPGFDQDRKDDPGYQREYLEYLYRDWEAKNAMLREFAQLIAGDAEDVKVKSREVPKSKVRAADKIDGYKGQADKLNDLVGSIVQYRTVDQAYQGLAKVLEESRRPGSKIQVVDFSDRFLDPQKSGYRDLQMNVRLELGDGEYHVAELRLHVKSIDDVADYEHALYEVRRDFQAVANADESRQAGEDGDRPLTAQERAMIGSILNEERIRFGEAFRLAGGRETEPRDYTRRTER
ncbi:toxin glutamine deamidase domain-containing protein [Amycolatopsis magusensis]|uniref:toxin glutamine deamidase domain-containing protein n=1 Tax=Amycolatopsis magusensis TaxID=882444 RepID=UPI0024A8FC43|nr:toxin glutamine deamidase domain-containing protein [Amycolatopsis magusensis]MDI5981283.1 toxin glutamine deamidase domain-containing protein [Amycolatopsis magusensis]